MLRCPGVPLLPGTVFRDVTTTRFPRRQKFMSLNGINMLTDRKHPCYGGNDELDFDCPPYELPSLYPPKTGPKLPPWIAHDKKVLVFFAYFKETLQEVYLAPYQVRKVKIYFYLEDGTMKIVEPTVENSGIPQGCLVARQRVPRPPPCQNEFISVLDLNVNQTIQMFDRIYHITGCDLFTRHFLNRAGIPVPDPVDMPLDPTTEMRKKAITKPKHGSNKDTSFAQFLKYDRYILKFDAYWEDKSEFGTIRNFKICFFLSDDTVEIKEILPVNSGRDGPTIFLKRQKLPKDWPGLPLPGEEARSTVLNVLGGGLRTGRYMLDALALGKRKITYYKDCDLQIGAHLNVFGRDFILTDCDGFTKEYYRKKYGIETFTPIEKPKSPMEAICTDSINYELPPWNGWGTHEDSEGNCIAIEPRAPHADIKKFIHLDRFVLRFGAKMLSRIKENCERIFIISVYLSDDTVQVFEIAERNSGFLGGEFFKRDRMLLPNQDLFTSKRPDYYKPQHFYIGATLTIRDHIFHIVSSDEYTLLYMEKHPFEFPFANIETIITKIREALRPIYKSFINKYISEVCTPYDESMPIIKYDKLRRILVDLLGNNITDHEIITVARHFSALKPPTALCQREKVRAAVHLEIRRDLWDGHERLVEHTYHMVPNGSGFVPEAKIRSIILACRLPFKKDLTDDVLSVLNRNENCEIELCDFINFIDVNHKPAPAIVPMNIAFELCPKTPFDQNGCLVDWNKLLEKIGLEETLKNETE